MKFEKLVARGSEVAVGSVALFRLMEKAYAAQRERRLPPGGDTQSILPFYRTLLEASELRGLVIASAGGIVKQALADPLTEFDVANRQYKVSTDWRATTLPKATLYRPRPEITLRDLDARVKRVQAPEPNGRLVDATAEVAPYVSIMAREIQQELDEQAKEMGFPRGPVLSFFTYENDFGHAFTPFDYATRTQLEGSLGLERLFANTGDLTYVPVDRPWECIVPTPDGDELIIPTDSPVTLIGRTLTRAVATRKRDDMDAYKAAGNLQKLGLGDDLLGATWQTYRDFRSDLDQSITLGSAAALARQGRIADAAGTLLALPFMPMKEAIEGSFIGMALRDPNSPIYTFQEKVMNVAG